MYVSITVLVIVTVIHYDYIIIGVLAEAQRAGSRRGAIYISIYIYIHRERER